MEDERLGKLGCEYSSWCGRIEIMDIKTIKRKYKDRSEKFLLKLIDKVCDCEELGEMIIGFLGRL